MSIKLPPIIGKIVRIYEPEIKGTFEFCDVDVYVHSDYPNTYRCQFSGPRVDLPAEFKAGQTVRIMADLKGREYTNKQGEVNVFTTVSAWSIEESTGEEPAATSTGGRKIVSELAPVVQDPDDTDSVTAANPGGDDNLPF